MEGEKITGEQLAAMLFAEQGYLVMGSFVEYGLGDIEKIDTGSQVRIPLRITGPSNHAEFERQCQLAFMTSDGAIAKSPHALRMPFYYRVEAAD